MSKKQQDEKDYLANCQRLEKKVLDCCTSSNKDDSVRELLVKSITNKKVLSEMIWKYPEVSYRGTKKILQHIFGKGQFFLGSGSEDLIVRINTWARLNKKRIAVVKPVFFRVCSNINITREIDYKNIFREDYRGVDVCWINNPNALNNSYIDKNKLVRLIDKHPKVIFIIDEASIFFLDKWKKKTLFAEVPKRSNLIVISSLSKYFGVPGIRFGFGSADKILCKEIEGLSPTFPVNSIANYWAELLLRDIKRLEVIKRKIERNRNEVTKMLLAKPRMKVKESELNFIWCCRQDGSDTYQELLKKGILAFEPPENDEQKWVRLTICSSDKANKLLITKLKSYV